MCSAVRTTAVSGVPKSELTSSALTPGARVLITRNSSLRREKPRLYFRGENGDLADPLFEMNKRKIAVRISVVRRLVQLREVRIRKTSVLVLRKLLSTLARGTVVAGTNGSSA